MDGVELLGCSAEGKGFSECNRGCKALGFKKNSDYKGEHSATVSGGKVIIPDHVSTLCVPTPTQEEEKIQEGREVPDNHEEPELVSGVDGCCTTNEECEDGLVCEGEEGEKVCKINVGEACEHNENSCKSGAECSKKHVCKLIVPCNRLRGGQQRRSHRRELMQ
jgi:hypothetical protein